MNRTIVILSSVFSLLLMGLTFFGATLLSNDRGASFYMVTGCVMFSELMLFASIAVVRLLGRTNLPLVFGALIVGIVYVAYSLCMTILFRYDVSRNLILFWELLGGVVMLMFQTFFVAIAVGKNNVYGDE